MSDPLRLKYFLVLSFGRDDIGRSGICGILNLQATNAFQYLLFIHRIILLRLPFVIFGNLGRPGFCRLLRT